MRDQAPRRLRIELPANRDYTGTISLLAEDGNCIAGPFAVCARSGDRLADEHGNPSRTTTLPYGDTPLGIYRVAAFTPTGTGTKYRRDLFGAHGAFILHAVSGDAALAEANGRFEILIHGGPLSPDGRLRATSGGMRIADDELCMLAGIISQCRGLICECFQAATLPEAVQVDGEFNCEEPGSDSPKANWITPRAHRVLTRELIAHGEYAPGSDPAQPASPAPEPVEASQGGNQFSSGPTSSPSGGSNVEPFTGETLSDAHSAGTVSGAESPDPFTGRPPSNAYTQSSSPDSFTTSITAESPYQGFTQTSFTDSSTITGQSPYRDFFITSATQSSSTLDEYASQPNAQWFTPDEKQVPSNYAKDYKQNDPEELGGAPPAEKLSATDDSDPKVPSSADEKNFGAYSATGSGVINAAAQIAKDYYTPVDASGNPIEGPLNLYSGDAARAAAESAPGYTIQETQYFDQAMQLEAKLRADLGIPTGNLPQLEYNSIWGTASRSAVTDAVLSGSGAQTLNDLASVNPADPLFLNAGTIQATTELPWLAGLGAGVGGINVFGGGLSLMAGLSDDTPDALKPSAIVGGAFQIGGGIAYGAGAFSADAAMMATGAGMVETGGLLAIPLMIWAVIRPTPAY
jgi:hypothetical protein